MVYKFIAANRTVFGELTTVQFPQRPGALKEFVNEILGPADDITYFQFSKKNNRESEPAVVGLELKDQNDFHQIEEG